ncbi:MAG: hypothetical protein H7Y04_08470, partial [Verrucomicrobia bacterium]|nr:hypothetical protein [Cytophagales bacterium]
MKFLKKSLRFFWKATIRTFLLLVLLLVLLLGALQLPRVQTYFAHQATAYLTKKLHFPVYIDKVSIRWLNLAAFKGIKVNDLQGRNMIEVKEMVVNFKLKTLLQGNEIWLNEVFLDKGAVRLIVDRQTGNLNIDDFVTAINELTKSEKPRKDTTASIKFGIEYVRLFDVLFEYADERKDSIKDGFDYNHIVINHLQGEVKHFFVIDDTVNVQVRDWSGVDENTDLPIHSLTMNFQMTDKKMAFEQLNFRFGKSILRDSVVFNYASVDDMGDFNDKVRIKARFDNTEIHSADLALFAPLLNQFEDHYKFSGDFNGSISKFRLRNLALVFGKQSLIHGNIAMEGLPAFDSTFINFDIKPSVLATADVQQYVDAEAFENVKKFGTVNFSGKFLGFTNDFITNGNFETDLGGLTSDMVLKLHEKSSKTYYRGNLTTRNFKLGELIDRTELVGLVDMQGKVEGTGLRVVDANFRLDAIINRIGIYGYDYTGITTHGKLSLQRYQGSLLVKDPNLSFDANGEVNFRNNINFFNIKADLSHADLKKLGFSKDSLTVKSKIDVNFTGLDPDRIIGKATLTDAEITYKDRPPLLIDSLFVRSEKDRDSTFRNIDVVSDFANLHFHGNFTYEKLLKDVPALVHEYTLTLRNDKAGARKYYDPTKNRKFSKYNIEYEAKLTDINPLFALFYPSLYLSKNTEIEGSLTFGKNAIFSMNSHIDTLFYGDYKFFDADIDLNTSKISGKDTVLGHFYVSSAKQILGKAARTEKMSVEAVWFDNEIDFTGKIRQSGTSNLADLRGKIDFFDDRTEVRFQPSKFQVLDNRWQIDPGNLIIIKGNDEQEVTFENFKLTNLEQFIAINGTVSQDSSQTLGLQIQDFDLTSLNPLVNQKIQGTVNGFAYIKDLYRNLLINSELNIEELVVNKFLIGNVEGKIGWDNIAKKLTVNTDIIRFDQQILTVYGYYDTQSEKNALNLSIIPDEMDLEILEPFTQGEVSKLGGKAKGFLRLTGSLGSPVLK